MAIDRVALLRNAEKLLRQGKLDQAIADYRRIVDDQPRDWNTANVLGDLYFRAGKTDKAVEQYTRIADSLSVDGFYSKASALYKKILKIRPHDEYVLLQAAEIAAGQELFVDARSYLHNVAELRRARGDMAGVAAITIRLGGLDPSDYDARLAAARAQVAVGDVDGAAGSFKQLAAELIEMEQFEPALVALREAARLAPGDVAVKATLARLLGDRTDAESADEVARLATELADDAVARHDWTTAARVLQQAAQRAPSNIPLLLRLVDVSVDGGLDDIATSAQTQLADAYLAAGSALEARFIAEDLVTRHPDDTAHVDRLRQALTMLGEADPDAVIAGRLNGLEAIAMDVHESAAADERRASAESGLAATEPAETRHEESPVQSSDRIENEPEAAPILESSDLRDSVGVKKPAEIDLSVVLADIRPAPVTPLTAAKNLDDVFADLRQEATRRIATNNPDQEMAAGLAFYHAGQLDFAIPRLEAASRVPAHRFAASAALGRLFLERGDTWHAIEWLERAAEVTPPMPADGHRLLYELADALEGVGEVARALAICLELRAEAGDYQDVAERVERLAKVQAG